MRLSAAGRYRQRTTGTYHAAKGREMKKISYSGYRFPPEIIRQAIWLYLRFTLSFRDLKIC
jgi:transposase-like protein